MYLLDTNVISELRKAGSSKASKNVLDWANRISASKMFLSAISILELEAGILLKERRDQAQGAILRAWFESHVLPTFTDRIIVIDEKVARRCAQLHVPNPKSERDALIAATALVHDMTVVTRNIEDFKSSNVKLINPWD